MHTITPPPDRRICGTACLITRNGPRRLTAMTLSNSAAEMASTPAKSLRMAAAVTTTSQSPNSAADRSRAAETSASDEVSPAIAIDLPPASRISRATVSAELAAMSKIATLAPRLARRRAVARPMPDPPPVTNATDPARASVDVSAMFPLPTLPRRCCSLASRSGGRSAWSEPVEQHRENDDRSLDHILESRPDPEQRQAVVDDADEYRPEERPDDCPPA